MAYIRLQRGNLVTIATSGWWGKVHNRMTSIGTAGWFSILGTDAEQIAGRFGGDILEFQHDKLSRKSGTKPRNPRTPAQYETRRLSTAVNKMWTTLTPGEQALWDTYGLYSEIAMGGFFAFHDNNTRLLFPEHPSFSFQSTPPDPPDLPDTPTGVTAKYLRASDEWEFAWITPNDANLYVQLWAWKQATYNIRERSFYTHHGTTRSDNLSIKIDASNFQPGTILEGQLRTLNLQGERSKWAASKEAESMIPESPLHFITVGKSNAEFALVQNAIDSILDASAINQYAIYVYPGIYEENLNISAYIHVIGVDKRACILKTSDGETIAALYAYSSIRNMTLIKEGTAYASCVSPELVEGTIVENCIIYTENPQAHCIYMVGGEMLIKNCDIEGGYTAPVEINDEQDIIVHAKIHNCRITGTVASALYYEIGFTPGNTTEVYNNTIISVDPNPISAQLNAPGTLLFKSAHNRLNGAIQGNISDLITIPYNVINVDV